MEYFETSAKTGDKIVAAITSCFKIFDERADAGTFGAVPASDSTIRKELIDKEKRTSEEIILTSRGLQRTNCIGGDKFEIIFGEKKVECNRFQASFVSPAIHRVLCSDNTIDKFEVNGYEFDFEVIEEFSRLMNGFSILINERNCESFRQLSRILENEELLGRISFELGEESITICNCCSRLKVKTDGRYDIEEEVEFIACHFYEFESRELDKLKELNIDVLERIFGCDNLCLEDEESLVEFISSLGEEYSSLYGFIECRFLSVEGIDKFLSLISFEELDLRLWESICRRLRLEILDRNHGDKRFREKNYESFEYENGGEFDGILSHLTKHGGGNVHEMGVVDITSPGDAYYRCWQVADHGWNNWWYSNTPNSWICFDFKDRSVSLQHYTLKSSGQGGHYFIQWEIEGSNDGSTWKSLDNRNTRDLCGNCIVKTYGCSRVNRREFFRFIRMRQTGKDSNNCDYLMLCNIEFFGKVKKLQIS
jgi:hypothetical protein